jgi:hypothetical protein
VEDAAAFPAWCELLARDQGEQPDVRRVDVGPCPDEQQPIVNRGAVAGDPGCEGAPLAALRLRRDACGLTWFQAESRHRGE